LTKTLHLAPGLSAGGSLREAIRASGRFEEVLPCPDDLSCGPIDTDCAGRTAWWAQFHGEYFGQPAQEFWNRAMAADDRLVLWFARHSASELAFFLALAEKLGERPYDIVDATTTAPAVAIIPPDRLMTLFDSKRSVTGAERSEACQRWRTLRTENAPFRIVTPAGLASAPIDYFDPLLLKEASMEWRRIAYVVGSMMGHNMEPYQQVGDIMLLGRIVALVEQGKLLADGDPWDMRGTRVRLPVP